MHSDRGKLELILRNLIHNALKYTEPRLGDGARRCPTATAAASTSP